MQYDSPEFMTLKWTLSSESEIFVRKLPRPKRDGGWRYVEGILHHSWVKFFLAWVLYLFSIPKYKKCKLPSLNYITKKKKKFGKKVSDETRFNSLSKGTNFFPSARKLERKGKRKVPRAPDPLRRKTWRGYTLRRRRRLQHEDLTPYDKARNEVTVTAERQWWTMNRYAMQCSLNKILELEQRSPWSSR